VARPTTSLRHLRFSARVQPPAARARMDDEDFIELLLQYGITPNRLLQILLFSVLAAMICVNVWLFKKVRKNWNSPSGNETIMDWCQNMNEIEVDFPLPKVEEDGKRPTSRDVECKITSNNIRFAFKGEKAPMLEGTLTKSVLPDECNCTAARVARPRTRRRCLCHALTRPVRRHCQGNSGQSEIRRTSNCRSSRRARAIGRRCCRTTRLARCLTTRRRRRRRSNDDDDALDSYGIRFAKRCLRAEHTGVSL
jgi:hypothetical protein